MKFVENEWRKLGNPDADEKLKCIKEPIKDGIERFLVILIEKLRHWKLKLRKWILVLS